MLLISRTYDIVTEESEDGFVFEFEEFSFRDLVRHLRYFPHLSSSTITPDTWVSSESEHLHYVGPANKEKYWVKALRLAFK